MGFLSGLLGGGGGTSVSTSNNTTVSVTVNPEISNTVDLTPVADLVDQVAQGQAASSAQVSAALANETSVVSKLGDQLSAINERAGKYGRIALAVAGLALAYRIVK